MNIMVHFIKSHLNEFDKYGERFHQDTKVMEERYQGRWNTHRMANYCWSIQRDCVDMKHFRRSRKWKFVSKVCGSCTVVLALPVMFEN